MSTTRFKIENPSQLQDKDTGKNAEGKALLLDNRASWESVKLQAWLQMPGHKDQLQPLCCPAASKQSFSHHNCHREHPCGVTPGFPSSKYVPTTCYKSTPIFKYLHKYQRFPQPGLALRSCRAQFETFFADSSPRAKVFRLFPLLMEFFQKFSFCPKAAEVTESRECHSPSQKK